MGIFHGDLLVYQKVIQMTSEGGEIHVLYLWISMYTLICQFRWYLETKGPVLNELHALFLGKLKHAATMIRA